MPVSVRSKQVRLSVPVQAGFTLVELIMTLVLIGILAAVAGPRFFAKQDFDERGYFEQTVAALRYAQKVAYATGCPVRVTLGAGGYALFQPGAVCPMPPATAATFDAPVLNPSDGAAFAMPPPTGVTLNSSLAQFFYCPQGYVAAAANGCNTATVVGANIVVTVGSHTANVIPGTGYVQVP